MNRTFNSLDSFRSPRFVEIPSNRFLLLCFLVIPALVVPAQETHPLGFEQWTAKTLAPYMAGMVEEAPTDPHGFAVRQLADYPNDGYMLVHRAADGPVEWHET